MGVGHLRTVVTQVFCIDFQKVEIVVWSIATTAAASSLGAKVQILFDGKLGKTKNQDFKQL
jgi:hypothetical protein